MLRQILSGSLLIMAPLLCNQICFAHSESHQAHDQWEPVSAGPLTTWTAPPNSNINYFAIAPEIGWSNGLIQMLLAYQRVVLGKNTDANDSVVFTFVHTF